MARQGRLGDISQCPHGATSPAVTGSPNVNVNGRPALRVTDQGVPTPCCPPLWIAVLGSTRVFINGLPAHRLGDEDVHGGGPGNLAEGSGNVNVGG